MHKFTKDKNGKDILISDDNFQVMMEWEKPYMEALVDTLSPTGDVLEIGFGLGYSANKIQSFNIKSHTIIENDLNVLEKLYLWADSQPHDVFIVEGSWQESLNSLDKFDSIFFDDSPNPQYPDPLNIRIYDFYYRILRSHANIGCKMTWYSDYPVYWLTHPMTEYSNRTFDIEIPNNVKYKNDIEIFKNKMFMPMAKFPYGTVPDAVTLFLDSNFLIGQILDCKNNE
jgi:hypothetical protein